ncbi:GNAT family N-acetyltransferase (plasmid) [Burkholderia glumae]|uniref:GNAT family N-acetyltransferase n=1 Tax=Burkholderia glumae TaxID=337 RepID=A0ABY5BDJ3_BURGL|nr:GNAT family N-acetyltransferase [Burkholderia glumae]USS44129.1 GNAT family N-acetyltransferase [Burkholderia glumae]
MFEIWVIEADGKRVMVRDDVADGSLARVLVSEGNSGAAIRGEARRYVAVPDPDATDISVVVIPEWQAPQNDALRERARLSAGGWAHFFIARVGIKEAGLLVLDLLDRPPHASIREIFVLPAYRRRGVARELLKHAIGIAKGNHLPKIVLEVRPLDSATSREFLTQWYRRSGFDSEHGGADLMMKAL